MKCLCTVLFSFVLVTSLYATDDANRAWAEIAQTGTVNGASDQLADRLKEFYKKYPDHPKAADAWIKEQALRNKAARPDSKKSAGPLRAETEDAPSLQERVQQAEARIRKAQAVSVAAGLGEMERCGRKLATDFPKEPAGWRILMAAAAGFGGEKAQQLYKDIATKAPTEDLIISALRRSSELERKPIATAAARKPPQQVELPYIGPINLAFTAIDGRDVNLARFADKVTLIYFWATWCPACQQDIMKVTSIYTEFHAQGLEIIGVSFDENRQALQDHLALFRIPWPQFYDGGGWDNAVNKTFGVKQLPTMYLVDKRGLLRDRMAGDNLRDKVWSLLQE